MPLKQRAGIAQLVEHNLAKVGVASSNLVSRSNFKSLNAHLRAQRSDLFDLFRRGGRVVMQRTATPCTPVRFRPAPPFLPFKINKLIHPNLVDFLTQKISKLNPKYYRPRRAASGRVTDRLTILFGRRLTRQSSCLCPNFLAIAIKGISQSSHIKAFISGSALS